MGRGEGGANADSSADIGALPGVEWTAGGKLLSSTRRSARPLWRPRGMGRERVGGRPEKGGRCTPIADSRY